MAAARYNVSGRNPPCEMPSVIRLRLHAPLVLRVLTRKPGECQLACACWRTAQVNGMKEAEDVHSEACV